MPHSVATPLVTHAAVMHPMAMLLTAYIQSKPKGEGVTLYFSPKFMWKNQRLNQVNAPWYIPAVPTSCAPNCPLRALRNYHRYKIIDIDKPELRKGRRRFFIPVRQQRGKELSAATISRWICTIIVDSHAPLQNIKSNPGKVKAHKVRGQNVPVLPRREMS